MADNKKLNYVLAFSHAFIYILLVTGIILALVHQITSWPIKPVSSNQEGFKAISGYLPVLAIPLISTIWVLIAKLDIKKFFRLRVYHFQSFIIGSSISLVYTIILYVFLIDRFHGPEIWLPVIILCLLNAFAEEYLFRFVAFELWENATSSGTMANIIQALLYAAAHYFIAGMIFCILSFFYGLLLGYIYQKNRNLLPVFISHFLIDLGGIGAIMLHY